MTDDFKTWETLVFGANTLIKTDSYMFVTKANTPTGSSDQGPMVEVFSSNYKSGFRALGPISLPDGEVTLGHSFTIMDINED
jgi:hypothetical protein